MFFKKRNTLYKRISELYNKLFKVVPYSDRLIKVDRPCMVSFKSNLGERLIYLDYFLYDEYSFYYMEKINEISSKSVFAIYVKEHEIKIIEPEYRKDEKQITPEEINLAILELEEHVNPLYELYLKDLKYHKEQEKKLESL